MNAMHTSRLLLSVLLVTACSLLVSGCFARANTGYSWGPEHPAVHVNAHADFMLWGAGVRGRFGQNIQEVALAVEGGVPFIGKRPNGNGDFISYVYGGINAVQFGRLDSHGRIGAGSPWLQFGGGWCNGSRKKGTCTIVGVDAEYSLRFFPFEPEPYIGVSLGVMFYSIPNFR